MLRHEFFLITCAEEQSQRLYKMKTGFLSVFSFQTALYMIKCPVDVPV